MGLGSRVTCQDGIIRSLGEKLGAAEAGFGKRTLDLVPHELPEAPKQCSAGTADFGSNGRCKFCTVSTTDSHVAERQGRSSSMFVVLPWGLLENHAMQALFQTRLRPGAQTSPYWVDHNELTSG